MLPCSASQVSVHLPVNRLAASMLAAVLYLASQPGADPDFLSTSQLLRGGDALGGGGGSEEGGAAAEGAPPAPPLPLLALSALRVLAWMSQVGPGWPLLPLAASMLLAYVCESPPCPPSLNPCGLHSMQRARASQPRRRRLHSSPPARASQPRRLPPASRCRRSGTACGCAMGTRWCAWSFSTTASGGEPVLLRSTRQYPEGLGVAQGVQLSLMWGCPHAPCLRVCLCCLVVLNTQSCSPLKLSP